MIRPTALLRGTLLSLLVVVATGCGATTARRSASVVDYLYPERARVPESPAVPVLNLPLKVGVAFVPSGETRGVSWGDGGLPETDRLALMNEVARRFRDEPYVRGIELIPSTYLIPKGGFANLDQVARMFDVDVVALISYDQVQFNDQRRAAITYLTVVGAYVVKGDKHDTRTLLDAAVFDVASRKLLFRAPGVSHVRGTSTAVNLGEQQWRDRERGFRLAAEDLAGNLERELSSFEQRVRETPGAVQVVQRDPAGGSGAGAVDAWILLATAALGAGAWRARRREDR